MKQFEVNELRKLYISSPSSHKGQNGRLMIIGGSRLFHAASLWALEVASRIVDMVFYSSVLENNEIVKRLKEEFRNGIIVPRDKLAHYMEEADCVLIGPGLPRLEGVEPGDDDTGELTERLLKQYKHKRWVIDGGSLQVLDPSMIPRNAILTPHHGEFDRLFSSKYTNQKEKNEGEIVGEKAKEYNCTILLKGEVDIVCSPSACVVVAGGNPGMTKGGTGDVLAGLVAALACKNDLYLAAKAGSYINKKAGERLFEKVGPYFNASDLAKEIPKVMKEVVL